MLLKDNLNNVFMTFHTSFTNEGENILKKVARGERIIKNNNFFFKTGDPIIKKIDFLKRFGTFMIYCLVYLSRNKHY